jgi:hypothetical protein
MVTKSLSFMSDVALSMWLGSQTALERKSREIRRSMNLLLLRRPAGTSGIQLHSLLSRFIL